MPRTGCGGLVPEVRAVLVVVVLPILYFLLINFRLAFFHTLEDIIIVPIPLSNSSRSGSSSSSSSSSSVLVSLADLSEQERHFIPGVYQYSDYNNNEDNGASSSSSSSSATSSFSAKHLIIRGASITSDYHAPGETLWFQLFALGDRVMDQKLSPNFKHCYFTDNDNNDDNNTNNVTRRTDVNTNNHNSTILPLTPWEEMTEEIFLCQVGTTTSRAILMPSNGVDSNTNQVVQIWRCPITLSRVDMENFYHHPTEETAIAVTVLHQINNNNNNNNGKRYSSSNHTTTTTTTTMEVVTIYLPSLEPSVGVGRVESSSPTRPFFQQRNDITLCVVAHPNGLQQLPEFIQYHHQVVGIDHIHVGLYLQHGIDNQKEEDTLPRLAQSLLAPDIEAGRVSFSTIWNTKQTSGISCGDQEYPKLFFYQECLYRAKSTSEFVATWDLDEFFLFHREKEEEVKELEKEKEKEAVIRKKKKKYHLPDFLRGLNHTKCPDWSFVTMKSSFVGGSLPGMKENYRTGIKALDAPRRTLATNTDWQKSISKTKNVFLNTFHLPGSCLIPPAHGNNTRNNNDTSSDVSEAVALNPIDDDCAFYVEGAQMIHAKNEAGGDGKGRPIHQEPTVGNELHSLLTGETYEEDYQDGDTGGRDAVVSEEEEEEKKKKIANMKLKKQQQTTAELTKNRHRVYENIRRRRKEKALLLTHNTEFEAADDVLKKDGGSNDGGDDKVMNSGMKSERARARLRSTQMKHWKTEKGATTERESSNDTTRKEEWDKKTEEAIQVQKTKETAARV